MIKWLWKKQPFTLPIAISSLTWSEIWVWPPMEKEERQHSFFQYHWQLKTVWLTLTWICYRPGELKVKDRYLYELSLTIFKVLLNPCHSMILWRKKKRGQFDFITYYKGSKFLQLWVFRTQKCALNIFTNLHKKKKKRHPKTKTSFKTFNDLYTLKRENYWLHWSLVFWS